ncbi:hypothetical protein POX_e07050 [Penicillium oxalicum]|uniref:Uncharacterized protein n=1 Tax=Penicillium oxalicum (strain 114-2 / CGMCC 5302) TaxID=933388 RepID=S7ZHB6_PENO1|nr:hypothetical protein POX_e07050 [Penicillium oxalicum]EPS28076.1 hypothetical protein PDE_03022 [Penicillium oxalicum 114-2]KAI2789024.1 hypothetical protein POX_e07050 [Penicillium oxalicum]
MPLEYAKEEASCERYQRLFSRRRWRESVRSLEDACRKEGTTPLSKRWSIE